MVENQIMHFPFRFLVSNPNPNPNPLPPSLTCPRCRTSLPVPPPGSSPSFFCFRCGTRLSLSSPLPSSLPNLAPSNPFGSKRAVICGVAYFRSRYELKGTLNDAHCIKYLLETKYGFPSAAIIMLTEDQKDLSKLPMKRNIMKYLQWLVEGCRNGDSLVFYFSGHGSQQQNRHGGEVDGMDETLLPMDFKTQGMIVDDEINDTIVRPLQYGVRLHAIIDSCHSGTVLDLPYLLRAQRDGYYAWEDHRPLNGQYKGTNGGEAFCFSGCDDNQVSINTPANIPSESTGAMTHSFILAIETGKARTYKELLESMRHIVQSLRSKNGNFFKDQVTTLLKTILSGGRTFGQRIQEPQLTASHPFDINVQFRL